MGETATYTLAVDWNNDGDFTDTGENISADLMGATVARGFASPLARMATTGRLTLTLRNTTKRYSPYLESDVLPRRPVRLQMSYDGTTTTLFRGYLDKIRPSAGIYRDRRVNVECVDAIALLDQHDGPIAIQENVYADDIIEAVVEAVYAPPATSYQGGINLFPLSSERWGQTRVAIGFERVSASRKIVDACASDWGRFYVSSAGAPTFINRHQMPLDTTTKLTLTNAQGLTYEKGTGQIFNLVEVTCQPRVVSDSYEVLGRLGQGSKPRLETGGSQEFTIAYRDPHNPSLTVGGKDALTPVAGLDLIVSNDEGGAGTAVTASINQSVQFYADKALVTLTNNSGAPAYVQTLQIRGRVVRVREAVTVSAADATSQIDYQTRILPVAAALMNSENEAQRLAEHLLAIHKDPGDVVAGIRILANANATLMAAVRDIELLDRVVVTEAQTGLSGYAGFIYRLTHRVVSQFEHWLEFDLETAFDVGGTPFRLDTSALNSGHILIY
jgi:hypothetical protein